MENQSVKLPFLKHDAKINITIGTQMVNNLQGVIGYLIELHADTEEKKKAIMESLKDKVTNQKQLEKWEAVVLTLTQFLKAVGDEAEKSGQMYYKEAKDILK